MKMPGFTAETSLYKAGESHYMKGTQFTLITDREIILQATRDCYDFNGHIICVPRAYNPWWKRWPDLLDIASLVGRPEPNPWSVGMPSTAISMQ